MLWLALHLPALSLEAAAAVRGPQAAAQPLALLAQHRVAAVNAPAQALGVQPGMKRATALALAPGLQQLQADAARDAQALRAVAHTLLAFTPMVVELPPQGVLAELQASLRCFGGAQALWRRIADALAPLGHQVQWASAPGALGAQWLSVWAPDAAPPTCFTRAALAPRPWPGEVRSPDPAWAALQQRLAGLPAEALLAADEAGCAALQAMGLATVADLRRQPRAGLARRFGPGLLHALDQAEGRLPDPREPLAPPLTFASQVELAGRSEHADVLLDAAGVLLARLSAWARARHARVQRFVLTLHHETRLRASALGEAGAHRSTLAVALAEPTADAAHWRAVLRERLAREPLAAPVLSLSLACDQPVCGPPPDAELFPAAAGAPGGADGRADGGLLRLLERLQARLGDDGVRRLAVRDEHRPECAGTSAPALSHVRAPALSHVRAPALSHARAPALPHARMPAPSAAVAPQRPHLTRPSWLLDTPQPLAERQSRPCLGSQPLRLLAGPERIETGWWDGRLVLRDYFIAQPHSGELLWIYRLRPAPPRDEPGWFLHGRFG